MRPVVLQFYSSLDGYSCDVDNGMRDVMFGLDDPEQEAHFVSRLWQAGTHVMGRVTYQEMAGFWPAADHPSAGPMNDIPKVVFSSTLQSADGWPTTRIARGKTEVEVARLRAEPGAEILVHGGTQFARSLIRLDLVDQYRLWVLPAAASRGASLFSGLDYPLKLRLEEHTAFPSGVLELVYSPVVSVPRPSPPL